MDLINQRRSDDTPIFRAFVERTLKKRSQQITAAQNEQMAGFASGFWKRKYMKNDDTSLIYTHLAAHRFVDMKTRVVKGKRKDKNSHEVHNRIIMGNYAGIMNELTFGLTEQMKEMMQKKIDKRQI